jgi:UDP-glucose 4-epimerase
LFLSKGLRVTTTRFFNVVGPKQSSAYGMVLPNFIESAMSGNPIRVFGDGKQTRVFCHVKDVVSALIKLLDDDRTIGEVFNIGGLEEISIWDLAVRVKNLLSSKSEIILETYQDSYGDGFEDMMRRTPDIRKLQKFIEWQPKFNLDLMIEDIANSYSK